MIKTTLRTIALSSIAAIVLAAHPAQAQDFDAATTSEAIDFSHVDLTTDAGMSYARHAIEHAARQVCDPIGNTRQELDYANECRATAKAKGLARLEDLRAARLAKAPASAGTALVSASPMH